VDPITIVIIAVAIALSAIGVTVAVRLIPLSRRVKQDLKSVPYLAGDKEDERRIKLLDRPAGRRRDSSIVDLVGNLIRHTDGSLTKAYHVTLDHSTFTEEHVIEGRVTYLDGFWSPFVAIHARPGIGSNIPLDTGVVGQIGFAPSKTWGALTLALPVTVSFDTDNFHGGDAGFAYVSAGLSATYAISKHVALNLGVTYYHTNDSVIVNPESDFVTGLAGFTVSF